MEEGIVELASVIKGVTKEVPRFEGFVIGRVISPPDDLRVSIDEAIILDKTNLIIAAHVLSDYEREFEIIEGDEISIDSSPIRTFTAKGKFKWTDTLKVDDLVILVPSQNEQMYILIDKGVEL